MPDPILTPIIIKLLLAKLAAAHVGAAVLAIAAVTVVLLTFGEITNWFADRQALLESDKDNLAFTLQQKLASGEYGTVQGIFNKRTLAFPAARTITSQRVDAKLAGIHAIHELALYN
jgi:hypothetical protein